MVYRREPGWSGCGGFDLHLPDFPEVIQEVFQIKGKGMPDPHGGRRGDLVVQVLIDVPKKLDKRQEELLRELASLEDKNVSSRRKGFLDSLKDYFTEE